MSGGGGADSGQAANRPRGFFAGVADGLGALWGAADPGALAGGGVANGQDTNAAAESWTERLKGGATDAVLGQYPGYGSLWTYDGGVNVTRMGQITLGGLAVAFGLLMFGGR